MLIDQLRRDDQRRSLSCLLGADGWIESDAHDLTATQRG
jgi:hypothetical protein